MLNLIRWKNLLMIAFVQLLIKYAFLEPFGVATALNCLGISILILATICIAAAGNIINDIYDIETDLVNKPHRVIIGKSISEKCAFNLFFSLNIIGVGLGFYLSHLVEKPAFFTIFVLISALLFLYASYLKRTFFIGNLIISILVGLSLLIVGVFELVPSMTHINHTTQMVFFKTIFDYALFAFLINVLREISKDIEDIDGDYKTGMHTLPIILGRDRTKHMLCVLNIIPLALITRYVIINLYNQYWVVTYFLVCIIGPLIYTSIKTFSAKTKKDFKHISNMYKLVMLFGMLSLLLYKYVILS
ncbi:geranylgeranylglycerol-phosphate geranylgeranyltransferase [Tamlana fucoidanivorans]|uniref:geranylgeranylglycerol-phosphate geranylgeranyltransferase n=1 Tax=Allotamlana fucoidanivorans TaxID=2583814 RepID=UPI00389297A0